MKNYRSNIYLDIKDLKIWQRRRPMKRRWKIDCVFFETFLLLYQVTQLLESSEVWLQLERGDCVRVQGEMVKFIALPFQFLNQLKIWSFHVVVVKGRQRNVQRSVMHVQSCCFAHKANCVLGVPVNVEVVVSLSPSGFTTDDSFHLKS